MADLLVPLHTQAMELGEIIKASYPDAPSMQSDSEDDEEAGRKWPNNDVITGPLWGESTDDRWIPLTKEQ